MTLTEYAQYKGFYLTGRFGDKHVLFRTKQEYKDWCYKVTFDISEFYLWELQELYDYLDDVEV